MRREERRRRAEGVKGRRPVLVNIKTASEGSSVVNERCRTDPSVYECIDSVYISPVEVGRR